MPTYLSPGVYVEEVPSAVKPIAGVGTSVAAFIGIAPDDTEMPLKPGIDKEKAKPEDHYKLTAAHTPQLVTNWGEFKNNFGDFHVGNQYLAHAVYGFFQNGGTRCWVNRVTTVDDVVKAIEDLQAIDEITIVAAPLPPDTAPAALNVVHTALVGHCELMEDRVAILDSSRDIANDHFAVTPDATGIWRPPVNSKGYGAFYFPWILVADWLQPAGTMIAVPPSGHIAGIYARSDAQRGVHKAPANELVMDALGLRYSIGKPLQQSLNPRGVNCIRSFNGTIKVWGARTLASDPDAGNPEWQYINVRRMFNYLRESIDEGTQWVVFEPNEPSLWAKITRNVTAFLTNVWRDGALFGATPQQAFYVKCDAETNPPEVREQGMVVTEIGVALVKPAEFVIFRLSQWAGPGK